ncbi:OprO/OprP family phosphate-selective porin [Novosphingobium colocasiae]|uniref:Porin n=1 Tax=Novosphingobium colocasiae TaxID=1256513 RepID=A0A918PCJ6_9SPHN|nr:porin [Novosphingobium colocasiae]GGY99364.1 hypothetical protein GCM10011614_12850 [Novosphingobium colocasiae]
MRSLLASTAIVSSFFVSAPVAWAGATPAEKENAALRAEIQALKARLEAIEARIGTTESRIGTTEASASAANDAAQQAQQLAQAAQKTADAAKNAKPAVAIGWKGSPQFTQDDKAFKVKGRIQADASYVSAPGALQDRGLGFSSEMRRIRLGGEGSLGAGFGYKLELELSDNSVDLVDTFVTYRKGSWLVQLGNQNPAWSLDELTGDTSGSVMERAAFTDAFNFERRLGVQVQYAKGPIIVQGGVFTDSIGDLANSSDGVKGGDENNSYSFDGRLVYAPKWGNTQFHFGASAHWRRLGRLDESATQYRQRPYIHGSNTRLIGTAGLKVDTELNYGVEVAALSGPFWGVGEFHVMRPNRVTGPTLNFRGGYAEVGAFLTSGDTRGYKGGIFVNNAPAHPMGGGGMGSIQVALRYDYLDLDDRDIVGGKQNGYIAALVWSPIQYLRFNVNYALMSYDNAVALPSGKRSYDANVVGTRFELDF